MTFILYLQGFTFELEETDTSCMHAPTLRLLSVFLLLHPVQLLDPIGPSGSRPGGASAPQQQPQRASRAHHGTQREHSALRKTTDLEDLPHVDVPLSCQEGRSWWRKRKRRERRRRTANLALLSAAVLMSASCLADDARCRVSFCSSCL